MSHTPRLYTVLAADPAALAAINAQFNKGDLAYVQGPPESEGYYTFFPGTPPSGFYIPVSGGYFILLITGSPNESRTVIDMSVNSGRVDGIGSDHLVLRTLTAGSVVGGFNGGGTGSKAIAAFTDAGLNLPLSSLASFEYTWLDIVSFSAGFLVYANLVVELDPIGAPGVYNILVVDPATPTSLHTYTTTVNPDGSSTTQWTSSNAIQVVGGLPPAIPPDFGSGPSWTSESYLIPTILAAYPNAILRRVASGDGGLPKLQVTPAFMLITGDSNNNNVRALMVHKVLFNGAHLV
jgi:hypothetical protein